MKLPIEKIDRVAVVVSDIQKATYAYSYFFGINKWHIAHYENNDFSYQSAIGGVKDFFVELIEPQDRDVHYKNALHDKGWHLSHITASSPWPNLEAELRQRDIPFQPWPTIASDQPNVLVVSEELFGLKLLIEQMHEKKVAVEEITYNEPGLLPVDCLYQVSVIVPNRTVAKAKFDEYFGLQGWVDIDIETGKTVVNCNYYGQPVDQQAALAIGRRGRLCFEVIEPQNGVSIYKDALEKYGPSLHHVLCTICSPQEFKLAAEKAKEKNIVVGQAATIPELMDFSYFDAKDQMGIFIEVICPLRTDWLDLMFPNRETAEIVVGPNFFKSKEVI